MSFNFDLKLILKVIDLKLILKVILKQVYRLQMIRLVCPSFVSNKRTRGFFSFNLNT